MVAQGKGKALADAITAQDEAEKSTKEEFEVGFFQGYANLKRRSALDHPEWDLAVYSGVDSDFWGVESLVVEK